jgi:alkylation response protein AidB-like acyl-CoA dehydrogenase
MKNLAKALSWSGPRLIHRRDAPGCARLLIESGTPGVRIVKLEHKMGIRVSDTAAISLVDARVPFENILGSPNS